MTHAHDPAAQSLIHTHSAWGITTKTTFLTRCVRHVTQILPVCYCFGTLFCVSVDQRVLMVACWLQHWSWFLQP